MDDTCAVCADTLEWVAYGPCGHREVCSTCIVRLRFICADHTCCICKSQCDTVFITKALGVYSRMINDFSNFPANPTEGQVGTYWYHERTLAFFDDADHYRMVKDMCRLSCVVCDKKDEQRNRGSKRKGQFNNVEQLKSHLFHRHELFMCSLCLESRKKLYTRAQLRQHVRTGDSVVDGNESERGGFKGHPMCEFCHNPFYGDNELYLHMSTEHFTCHICRRQHPGEYEYYRNYDDLENHFRQQHFLCEDDTCLAKKFIVFASELEMKRHNATEHGGRMSRSKRNAALQIPISFQYRRSNEQYHRGRGYNNHPESSDDQLLETTIAERSSEMSLNTQTVSGHGETSEIQLIVNPFESLATNDLEPSSRNRQVSRNGSLNALLEDSSFPPLPVAPRRSQLRSTIGLAGSGGNTMAARLRRHNAVKVFNSSRASRARSHDPNSMGNISFQPRLTSDSGALSPFSSSSSLQSKPSAVSNCIPPNRESHSQAGLSTVNELIVSSNIASSSRTSSSTINCSASDKSVSNNTPVSGAEVNREPPRSSQPPQKAKNVQHDNKALMQKIRAALEYDEDKFKAFKIISTEYRQNVIDTAEYLAYVNQFGLSDLVLELARLCPDVEKQRELVEIYNLNMRNGFKEKGLSIQRGLSKSKKSSKKGKEKFEDNGTWSSENATSSEQMSSKQPSSLRNAVSLTDRDHPGEGNNDNSTGGALKNSATGGGKKPTKKTSKFLRNRLGQTSAATFPDDGCDKRAGKNDVELSSSEVLPVRGVWRNGGGHKLLAMTQGHGVKIRTL